MRKTILSLVLLFAAISFLHGQAVKNLVVVEIGTGTWCGFCPGSALGADDLVLNGHDVAVLEHHSGDSYETPASSARVNFYSIPGYPTTFFDGGNELVGGDPSNSLYSSYLPKYNAAINQPTPIAIDMSLVNPQGSDYEVTVNVTLEGTLPAGAAPVLHVALTESHIPHNWLGLNEVNFVTREMMPDASGTPLTLTQGNTETVNFNFMLNSLYDMENSELVAFVQDPGSKTIFNGAKASLNVAAIPIDVSAVEFTNVIPETYCESEISPEITFTNQEGPFLNSLDITYSVNGGTPSVYNWTGSLAPGASESISLPSIAFTPVSFGNELTVELSNPNGIDDPNMANNMLSANWDKPAYAGGDYNLEIKLDQYGSEITWAMLDASNNVLASGGPYADGTSAVMNETFNVPGPSNGQCLKFGIYDSWGDGLQFLNLGYYKLYDPSGTMIAASLDGDFGAADETVFETTTASALEPQLDAQTVRVYPNPTANLLTVEIMNPQLNQAELELYQITGSLISTANTVDGTYQFDLSSLPSGIYLLKVRTQDGVLTEKITKQ